MDTPITPGNRGQPVYHRETQVEYLARHLVADVSHLWSKAEERVFRVIYGWWFYRFTDEQILANIGRLWKWLVVGVSRLPLPADGIARVFRNKTEVQ